MTWLTATADGETSLSSATGLRPELAQLLDDYLAQIWAAHDPVVLELCRLRIAMLHGDDGQQRIRHESAVSAGLDEPKIAAIADYYDSPLFTEHERACLAYAEQYVVDVHGITDDAAANLQTEMTDAEFVAFTVALGLFDGIGRMRLMLGVEEPPGDTAIVVPTPAAGVSAH